jgi:hypothetical protein
LLPQPFENHRIGYTMVKICEPGQSGCNRCGGGPIHYGSGKVRYPYFFFGHVCPLCDGKGWRPVIAPPLPPDRNAVVSKVNDSVRQKTEVVILHRYEPVAGRHAIVCVDGEEVAEIPITQDQSQKDEFFAALKKMVLHLIK